ncbi:MAG: hypothetical protein ACRCUL_07860, partial [Plesiomonas sp.]
RSAWHQAEYSSENSVIARLSGVLRYVHFPQKALFMAESIPTFCSEMFDMNHKCAKTKVIARYFYGYL